MTELDDRAAQARLMGYSWDEINSAVGQRRQDAMNAGYSSKEIDTALGFTEPDSKPMEQRAQAEFNRSDPTKHGMVNNPWEAFVSGVQSSSAGLVSRGMLPDKMVADDAPRAQHLAQLAGVALGDIPAMVLGAWGGAGLGAAAGTAVAPGIGTVIGTAGGAGFGAMALPEVIKREYIDGLTRGKYKDAWDYAQRQSSIWWNTAKAGITGTATALAGEGAAMQTVGRSALTQFAARSSAELAAMTSVSAGLEGRLPSKEELMDGAILLAAMKTGTSTAAVIRDTTRNIGNYWAKTGQPTSRIVQDAVTDPFLRTQLLAPEPEPLPAGSSVTRVHEIDDDFVVGRLGEVTQPSPTGKPNSELAHSGVKEVDDLLQEPAIRDAIDRPIIRRGDVPYGAGASKGRDPTVNIDHHVPEEDEIGGVKYDPRVPVTIHETIEKRLMNDAIAKFKDENGKAPTGEELDKIYEDAHDKATKAELAWVKAHGIDEDTYQQHWNEWLKHIEHEDPADPPRELYDKPYPHQDINGARHEPLTRTEPGQEEPSGVEGATKKGPPKPIPALGGTVTVPANPGIPTFVGTVEEARALINAHVAGAGQGKTLWDRVRDGWFDIYRKYFRPDHPVNKLTDALRTGGPIEDARNPDFMARLSELSASTGRYMIERNMVDTKGRVIGKGLREILEQLGAVPNKSRENWQRFQAYAVSKWALEKAMQGKETGVEIEAAAAIVAHEEAGGVVHPGLDMRAVANTFGVTFRETAPGTIGPNGTSLPVDIYGPHYNGKDKTVHMWTMPDADYEKKYGPGMTYDVVLAHEMGHAVADAWGKLKGFPKGGEELLRDLHDTLMIFSRRFKPAMWGYRDTRYFRKPDELMADGIATWMTQPETRYRLGALSTILLRSGVNIEKELGPVMRGGTTISRTFEDIIDWQNGTIKFMRDAGLLTDEGYQKMVAENKARIPGYRFSDDIPERPQAPTGPGNVYKSVKDFLGSDKPIKNLYESLIGDAFMRVSLARRNMQNVALARAASETMLGGFTQKTPVKFDLTMREIDKIQGGLGGLIGDVDTAIWRMLGHELRNDEVPIFVNGAYRQFKFEDPHLTEFLRGYDQVSLNAWQKMVGVLTRVTRNGIVLNPLFPVRLLTYDVPWQFVVKPGFKNTVAQVYLGLRDLISDRRGTSDMYDRWMRSGGAERVFDGLSKNEYIKDELRGVGDPSYTSGIWNAVTTPFHALRAWGQMVSSLQRVGKFHQMVDAGESDIAAAVGSSEAAFHRAGFGGPATKVHNAVNPFFAAYLNSLEQTFRGALGIGRTLTGEQFNAGGFAAKALAVVTIPMLTNYLMAKDEAWYKAAPDWQKDNGLLINVGSHEKPTVVFVKLPPLISFVYGGIPRRLMEGFMSEHPRGTQGLAGGLLSSVLPPGFVAYNLILPVIEHAANHSFFRERPLVSKDTENSVLPAYQDTQYSTETAKGVARFVSDVPLLRSMKLSPEVIDNYIQGWGGTLGEAAVRGTEMALQKAGVIHPERPAPSLEDMPLLRSWLSRFPTSSAQPITEFMDRMHNMSQVHGTLNKLMKEGDVGAFQKVVGDNPAAASMHAFSTRGLTGALVGTNPRGQEFANTMGQASADLNTQVAGQVLQADKAIKTLRQYAYMVGSVETPGLRTEIENIAPTNRAGPLTPQDKRQILDRTYAMMQVIAEEGNHLMDKLHLK